MLFTDTMTVFNCIGEETYKRTIVKGVQWTHNKVEVTTAGTTQTERRVESITVDFGRDYGNPVYVDPITYGNLTDKEGFYTFNSSEGKDYVVLGICNEDLTLKEARQQFQYVGVIERVSDNRNRDFLKSIKVIAR